jgi:hypothetical protein
MSTNNQPAVGIAGVQAAARSSGSTTRAGSKKFFLLAIKWAPLIGLLLALAFLWKDYAGRDKSESPIDDWVITPIGVGCGVKFSHDEKLHRVQYRYHGIDWTDYVVGTSPNATEFRHQALKKGVPQVQFRQTCS